MDLETRLSTRVSEAWGTKPRMFAQVSELVKEEGRTTVYESVAKLRHDENVNQNQDLQVDHPKTGVEVEHHPHWSESQTGRRGDVDDGIDEVQVASRVDEVAVKEEEARCALEEEAVAGIEVKLFAWQAEVQVEALTGGLTLESEVTEDR